MSVPGAVADRITGATLPAYFATSVNDRPHVAPVWYDYADGHLRTITHGQKLENVRANPRVAISIEQTEGERWVATLRGTATVVADEDRTEAVARRIYEQYLGDPEAETYRTEEGDPDGSLVDVRIGSASVQTL